MAEFVINKDGNPVMSHSDVVKVQGGRTLTEELNNTKDCLLTRKSVSSSSVIDSSYIKQNGDIGSTSSNLKVLLYKIDYGKIGLLKGQTEIFKAKLAMLMEKNGLKSV